MPSQTTLAASQGFQGGLRHDGLHETGDELAQQAPGAGPCQAALGRRGETSSASTSGSSRRMARR